MTAPQHGPTAPRPVPSATRARAAQAWRINLRWTAVLLTLWFACTFGVSWFARELRFDFFGWPFSFWAGAQGLLILYVLMAALYAWRMNRAYAGTERDEESETHPGSDTDRAAGNNIARHTGRDAA